MRCLGVVYRLDVDRGLGAELARQLAAAAFSGAPTQMTRPAPISCAAATARMPIGPEPWMTTVSPQLKPPARVARLKARMQEVSGSDSAPSRSGMSSGSL